MPTPIDVWKRCRVVTLSITLLLVGALGAAAEPQSVFPDLNSTARLKFNTGRPGKGGPEINPNLPDIPGPTSGWVLTQWYKTALLDPTKMTRSDVSARDPLLGAPLYSFAVDVSRLDIYSRKGGGYVFGLSSKDGALTDVGGTNVFLAANALPGATFDRELSYSIDITMPIAAVTQDNDTALTSGAVGAQVVTGFTLQFSDPSTKLVRNFFMQIEHSDARNKPVLYRGCFMHGNNLEMVISSNLPGEGSLPFTPFASPARHLTFRLGDHLCELIDKPFNCPGPSGRQTVSLPESAHDFGNWKLTSMYVGLETQNSDKRSSSKIKTPQGSSSVEIRIFSLQVLRDESRSTTQASCPRH